MTRPLVSGWPSFVPIALGLALLAYPGSARSQDPKKGDSTKASSKKKEEPKKPAVKPKPKAEPPETFTNPGSEQAAKQFEELFNKVNFSPADEQRLDQMATGQAGIDRALIQKFIQSQASQLTRKSYLQAVMDPVEGRPSDVAKIDEATARLTKPLLAAASPQNDAFRQAYVKELLGLAPRLLKNHLFARNAIMSILGESRSRDPQVLRLYADVLNDPNQVLSVKLQAAIALTKAAEKGKLAGVGGGREVADAASALVNFLQENKDSNWFAQYRALEALGDLRVATATPLRGKPEIAELSLKFLVDSKAKPDVRAYAARALGMISVPPQVKDYNYALVAQQIAQLAVVLGDRVVEIREDQGPRAQHLTSLLFLLVKALNGDPEVRDSGIAQANSAAVAPYADKVKAVALASLDYVRAVGVQLKSRQDALTAAVKDLKAAVSSTPPKERSLVPGGDPVDLAGAPAPAAAAATTAK